MFITLKVYYLIIPSTFSSFWEEIFISWLQDIFAKDDIIRVITNGIKVCALNFNLVWSIIKYLFDQLKPESFFQFILLKMFIK